MIRNPDRVKNIDTPRNPPLVPATPPWNNSTAPTASAAEAVETCLVSEPARACVSPPSPAPEASRRGAPRTNPWAIDSSDEQRSTPRSVRSPQAGVAVMSAAVIRVGVTGHRNIDDEAEVGRRLVAAVRSVRGDAPAADVEIWSSLAEGADTLVAELSPTRPVGSSPSCRLRPRTTGTTSARPRHASSSTASCARPSGRHRRPGRGRHPGLRLRTRRPDGRRMLRRAPRAVGRGAIPRSWWHGADGRRGRQRGRDVVVIPVARMNP